MVTEIELDFGVEAVHLEELGSAQHYLVDVGMHGADHGEFLFAGLDIDVYADIPVVDLLHIRSEFKKL